MNENIDLTKILKDCPKGTEFWSDNYGTVKFVNVGTEWDTPIKVELTDGRITYYTEEGWCNKKYPANCLLWPSRDCRDWSKFTPQLKKERFNPNTLKAFDKVLVRSGKIFNWSGSLFSNIDDFGSKYPFSCLGTCYRFCIPYNDDTKHLLGTKDEAPEFYKYWEDELWKY